MIEDKLEEGQYYYKPHRRSWGVWKVGKTINNTRIDDFISDFSTQIQAKNFVYKMNGWLPKEDEEQV